MLFKNVCILYVLGFSFPFYTVKVNVALAQQFEKPGHVG